MNQEDRAELKEMLSMMVKPIVDLQQEHHRTLFGNGSDSNQGLRVDVDRLKQSKGREEKHVAVLYAGFIGVAARAVWEWISGGGAR